MANTEVYNAKSDDVLECFLYPQFCFTTNPEQVTEELLHQEIEKYNEKIEIYTRKYIWHRDSIQFYPRTKRSLLLEAILKGSGDAGNMNNFLMNMSFYQKTFINIFSYIIFSEKKCKNSILCKKKKDSRAHKNTLGYIKLIGFLFT